MTERPSPPRWARHILRREERTRTTWTFRLGVVALAVLALWLTRGWWSPPVARSLSCDENLSRSDALLLENFDPDYPVFQRAARLRKAGVAERVLVPARTDAGTTESNAVAVGTADVMARIARLGKIEVVPIPEVEPISLNAAYRIREFLERERIRSVTVVTPMYRSRRSSMVYAATLAPAGIAVRCVPVPSPHPPNAWTESWHGIQYVTEQWFKLQYYRFYVLPFVHRRHGAPR